MYATLAGAVQQLCLRSVSTSQTLFVVMVQGGQLLSFGRATYGRIGRLDVNPKGDDSVPEARPVDNSNGITVKGMAAGEVPCLSPARSCVNASPMSSLSVCISTQSPRQTCWCLPHACRFASISIICLAYIGLAVEVKLTLMQ